MSSTPQQSPQMTRRSRNTNPDLSQREAVGVRPTGDTIALKPEWKRHEALDSDLEFTPEEWFNINTRIRETVDTVLTGDVVIHGPGPRVYSLTADLGVALMAFVFSKPIDEPCSLSDPILREKILNMRDPTHMALRHHHANGVIWFYFGIVDLDVAKQPLDEKDGCEEAGRTGSE